MLHIKNSEIYLFLSVFIISLILFLSFFLLATEASKTEQTYEMTDHQLKETQTEQQQTYEQKRNHTNEQSVVAVTLSY
ncbi:DNA damage-induced cell division inhibitor SosA [Staphylococcus cornubiensis]|uniref:DNA damage-induced cell division inhibitor SosA n=1 Tax=Staphylococcus cornubiensis TaxID=1986155 RepID=UPI000A3CD681|nr:DNA damage-induced cell division inhibitor SosA [Staphylococcus cornubiensis]